jgi:hypothetical protein
MQTVRRLYLYAVTFVSMETVLWGAISLVRSIIGEKEIGGGVSRLAGALSLILVGLPVLLLHWWLAQRSALKDPEERASRLRAVFLYGTLLGTLVPTIQNTLAFISRSLLVAFGQSPFQALIGANQSFNDNLIAILLNSLVAAYIFYILRSDWLTLPQDLPFTEVRRLYRYLWLLYTLGMVLFGFQQVLKYILSVSGSPGGTSQAVLANGIALLLAGIPLWALVSRWIDLSLEEPAERYSLLRLVVLYILTLAGIGAALASTGLVLYVALRALLGESLSLAAFLAQISSPFSIGLPLGAVWAYYGRFLYAEMNAFKTPAAAASATAPTQPASTLTAAYLAKEKEKARFFPSRSGLRRLYYYLLALAGLVAAFVGLQNLLTFILNLFLSPAAVWGTTLRMALASSIATLVIGLPLWILTWRPMVLEAGVEGESGDRARRSVVRKGYLFLVLFAAVLGVMFSTGELLYQLISALLGQPSLNLLLSSLQTFKIMALFGLFLVYHWWALRADNRLAGRALARRYAQFPVLVLVPDEGDFANRMVSALEHEAAELPVAIHPYSQGVPDESLSAAKAVVLPAELVAKPSEAIRLWLQGFTGSRLVVPTPSDGWLWVFGGGGSLSALAHRTAITIRHLAEGEEAPLPRDSSAWTIVVYIFAGLFALEILLGIFGFTMSLIQR